MSNSVTGRVIKILNEVTGTGSKGNWKKRGGVIETLDQYPKKIYFEAWGDKVDQIANLKLGQNVTVHFNLESREFNERWYTEARAWKIESKGDSVPVSKDESDESESLPF